MSHDFSSAKNQIQQMADTLLNLSPQELSLIAFTLGFTISPTLTINQQNSVGNFFILFGQVLLTFNAHGNYLVNLRDPNDTDGD